jgi:flavin prenyltransferase
MKIVIGISGSSGTIYAKYLIESLLKFTHIELAIVVSENAKKNIENELSDFQLESYEIKKYSQYDFNAPFASGSAQWDALIVCPCSAGFMAKVSNGIAEDLMSRAAQVMLKERKKLILVLRETPLSLIHIENMRNITLAGGIICPAIPSFYSNHYDIDNIISSVTNRVIDLVGIDSKSFRWGDK